VLKKPRKRSSERIIQDILELCLRPYRFTRVMYLCYLSYYMTKKYLGYLVEKGLIVLEGNYYKTTEKGREVLKHLRALRRLLGSPGAERYDRV